MAYKRQIDRLPIIPKDAKEFNVTCHYCIVGCGYKAYSWPVNKQGGAAADQNKFGVDLGKQQPAETAAWYAPSMYNIVQQNGEDVHIVIKPDKDCVVNSGLGSVRGARMRAQLRSPESLVALVCIAQVFVQIGASFWPALLPEMIAHWQLSNSEAGWITAIFYGAYLAAVPVLVTLTDRVDAKRVYLFGVGCTVIGHLLFGLYADGFWSAMITRALTGMWPDRSMSHELVNRAKAAGYKALVVTVDGVSAGNREYNIRNGFTIPFSFSARNVFDMVTHPRWLLGTMMRYLVTSGMPMYANYPAAAKAKMTKGPVGRSSLRTDSISWADLDALRKIWPHKLIVKGVLDPQDAAMAVDHGADGIDVSNHGGRNLDGIVSPIEVLPEIVDAVGKRATVFMLRNHSVFVSWAARSRVLRSLSSTLAAGTSTAAALSSSNPTARITNS